MGLLTKSRTSRMLFTLYFVLRHSITHAKPTGISLVISTWLPASLLKLMSKNYFKFFECTISEINENP